MDGDTSRTEESTIDTLIDAVRAIVPELAREAAETERHRRVTGKSLAAVRATGVLALGTPPGHGGLEADLTTRLRVLTELGRGCPSTAWIVATTFEAKAAARAALPERLHAEVFADPHAVMCASARPGQAVAEPGGLRISGRWGYASGCEHATWALLLAATGDASRPVAALVPAADLTVDRDWHVAGLSGTGSHTLTGENVRVPDSHALDVARMSGHGPQIAIALGLFAPLLGAAQGARDVVAAALHDRPAGTPGHRTLAEVPGAQQTFAEAALRIDTAGQRLLRVAATVEATPETPDVPLRMELRAAVRECRTALDDLLDLHGSSGFASANPLQRFWRDFAVGSRHVQFAPHTVPGDYGRLLLAEHP